MIRVLAVRVAFVYVGSVGEQIARKDRHAGQVGPVRDVQALANPDFRWQTRHLLPLVEQVSTILGVHVQYVYARRRDCARRDGGDRVVSAK